jgi:hypothetical protein
MHWTEQLLNKGIEGFKNKHSGSSCLIIGNGPSTKELIKIKAFLKSTFDVIIGVNQAHQSFDKQMDYHMVLERRPFKITESLRTGDYDTDMPRIIDRHEDAVVLFPQGYNYYTTLRADKQVDDIREIKPDKGLMFSCGKGIPIGTVVLQALHFACFIGCTDIFLIGTEFCWKDNFNDHFYGNLGYRDKHDHKKILLHNSDPFNTVMVGDMETTDDFIHTAKYIDRVIEELCRPAGIEVFIMCDSLITKAKKYDLDKI